MTEYSIKDLERWLCSKNPNAEGTHFDYDDLGSLEGLGPNGVIRSYTCKNGKLVYLKEDYKREAGLEDYGDTWKTRKWPPEKK